VNIESCAGLHQSVILAPTLNAVCGIDAPPPSTTGVAYVQKILCAHDPNDLTVYPIGCGPTGVVDPGTTLAYTIDFQNTGDAPAHRVIIQDTLDPGLDPTTLQILPSAVTCC
jgi:uncharacterized repeat protein (TIGR01451 family)